MATRDFEVQQLLKAYRKGLISDELFAEQMKDVTQSNGGLAYCCPNLRHHLRIAS